MIAYKDRYTYEELKSMDSYEIMDKMCHRLNEKFGRSLFVEGEMTRDRYYSIVETLKDFSTEKNACGEEALDLFSFLSGEAFSDFLHGQKGPNSKVADMYQLIKLIGDFNKKTNINTSHNSEISSSNLIDKSKELNKLVKELNNDSKNQELNDILAGIMISCMELCSTYNLDPKEIILEKISNEWYQIPASDTKN